MNFQVFPQPSEFVWSSPKGNGKTQTASAIREGRRLSLQVPACRTRMFRETASTTLYLCLDTPIQKDFGAFVKRYEDYISTMEFARERTLSSCIKDTQNTSFRLPVWETQWFDQTGTYLKEAPAQVHGCSALLEFQGCWVNATHYGLKFKVVQIRLEDCVQDTCNNSFAFLEYS